MGQYQSGPLLCCAIIACFYEQLTLFPLGIIKSLPGSKQKLAAKSSE